MGNTANKQMICEVLMEAVKTDKNIVALCSDSRGSASLAPFAKEFPQQFVEMGIAEQSLVSTAAGMARCGLRPFAASPASFLSTRSMEQVKVDVTVRIQPAEGSDRETVAAGVEAAVRNWFSGERLGKPVLLAQLYSLVFSCGGVANCKLAAPADDVEIAAHQLPVLGTLTVEELT